MSCVCVFICMFYVYLRVGKTCTNTKKEEKTREASQRSGGGVWSDAAVTHKDLYGKSSSS